MAGTCSARSTLLKSNYTVSMPTMKCLMLTALESLNSGREWTINTINWTCRRDAHKCQGQADEMAIYLHQLSPLVPVGKYRPISTSIVPFQRRSSDPTPPPPLDRSGHPVS